MFFVCMITCVLSVDAFASPIEEKTIEQQVVLNNILNQQKELDKLSNLYTELMLEKEEIDKELKQIQKEISDTNNKIEETKEKLCKQCNIIYKNDNIAILNTILETNSFENFVSNVDYYNKFLNQTDAILSQLKNFKQSLAEKQEIQNIKQLELEQNIQDMEEEKKNADIVLNELQEEYKNLDVEIAQLLLEQLLSEQILPEQLLSEQAYTENTSSNNAMINYLVEGNLAEQIYQSEQSNIVNNIDYNSSNNNDIVSRAYSMLGTPYSWGGTTSSGFDCSGFVSYCLTGQEGTRLGTTETFSGWTQVSDPQPGDICVIHNGSSQHTGVYVGNGNMVHASTYGVGVIESPVQDGMIYVTYN